MELKVNQITFPEIIEFNYDELKKEITEKAAAYANLVYTDDQIKDAKKDRAALNKFVKALSDERIKIKKQCLKPYEEFEHKIKELDGIVNRSISNIDEQIKAYEENLKIRKFDDIIKYFEDSEHPDWLKLDQIMDDKWLNLSVSMTLVEGAINARLETIKEELEALEKLPKFSFEAVETYKTSLDVKLAIKEGIRLEEIQQRKIEAEKRKALEEEAKAAGFPEEANKADAPEKMPSEDVPFEEKPAAPQRKWLGFKALMTLDDAKALKEFFNSRGIDFKPL